MEFNIRILNEDWERDIREAALFTVHKDYTEPKNWSVERWHKELIKRHSTFRSVLIRVIFKDVSKRALSHIIRHTKEHPQPFVPTSREEIVLKDDQTKNGQFILQGSPWSFIEISRERLCKISVHKDTYETIIDLNKAFLSEENPLLKAIGLEMNARCILEHRCTRTGNNTLCKFADNLRSIKNKV